MTTETDIQTAVKDLFAVGAHYGYPKSRRHPTTKKYIFGVKNNVEIFDLEKTAEALTEVCEFVENLAATGKKVLFVGGKREAQTAIASAASVADAPFVAGRWVGGTLSNFDIIRKRVEKLLTLTDEREKGTLTKYTKKERLMIDRQIKRLDEMFGGIRTLTQLPGAVVVVDPRFEKIARAEALMLKIPLIALANSDCDIRDIKYVIPCNDASIATITHVVGRIAKAYSTGVARAPKKAVLPERKPITSEERPVRRPVRPAPSHK